MAPVVTDVPEGGIDPPTGHVQFAGTITVPDDGFKSTLVAAARSLKQHGTVHVVLMGGHGSINRNSRT